MEGVVSVFPNEIMQLHTTRSWDFIGFPQDVKRKAVETNITIAVLDTGIWPESPSFNDSGYGPPPKKFKGICETSKNFTCNNKIIGAKHYHTSSHQVRGKSPISETPRDTMGHGSHTASTAAGETVIKASLYGLGAGTARGGVPSARIAVYKVCWSYGCSYGDILAAFDDAAADGVDIISISIGPWFHRDYFKDSIAIGAFHAMKHGILTSISAGNFGPSPRSINNFSPWYLSVGANVIDRKFVADVVLGNNKTYQGVSVNTFNLSEFIPIVYAGDVPAIGSNSSNSRYCDEGTLYKAKVNGTIVLCDLKFDNTAVIVLEAGGAGVVMADRNYKDIAATQVLPATYVDRDYGTKIHGYINTTRNPTDWIKKSMEIIDKDAPYVVSFSSRGPSPITPDILKPDLTAPGVDILAAWSKATTVTRKEGDTRVVPYNIISGTSMSCPHATGAAAYVKSFHPTWSPAAIKSALMTTATVMAPKKNKDAEFAYGSGQINPVKAVDPGLVYDMKEADYVSFLCVWDLNYPSFALSAKSGQTITRVFHRTVTNVGNPESTYKAKVKAPSQMKVQVKPSTLSFDSKGQKKSFTLKVSATIPKTLISGSLVWEDGVHQDNKRAADSLLYSYKRSFNGFLARMTDFEKERIASMEGVVSVFRNGIRQLLTTRSWDFIGFPQNAKRTTVESDIIVAMLDTGIWPESKSFSDSGYGPPPKKFKGTCEKSKNFTCNNKIIGAKHYFTNGQVHEGDVYTPRDTEGHGSHTASTAAGVVVSKASLYGLGEGTARGGVPSARIAVYKICWAAGCYNADILAAFDDAIADGVDIISLSVGGFPENYFEDVIAIGAFHSMKHGILTSNSAGNSGPFASSVTNIAPWSLTVAASVIDRKFVADVILGNKKTYRGVSVNTFNLPEFYPLVYGGDVPNVAAGFDSSESRYCIYDSLDKTKVNGTIVLCDELMDGTTVLSAGGVGTIMQDAGNKDYAFSFPLSATYLGTEDGSKVDSYINTTSKPTALIQKSIEIKDKAAPYVVSFSSRGPNPITADILKPDLTAPGVDIIAAWSEATTVTGLQGDTRVVPYNIISGTSMSCPHATGAAAYIKSFHPTWSPAAIKSSLMTTATLLTPKINKEAEFAYGSGQINPIKAVKPGLVYDSGEADYVSFLCGQGYNTTTLRLVTGDNTTSCTKTNNATVWDLNYPSFTLSAKSGQITRVFHRTVTNVGTPVSTYTAKISAPPGLKIEVKPSVLSFKSLGQKKSFTVQVTATIPKTLISGSLVWDDGVHHVRSPISTAEKKNDNLAPMANVVVSIPRLLLLALATILSASWTVAQQNDHQKAGYITIFISLCKYMYFVIRFRLHYNTNFIMQIIDNFIIRFTSSFEGMNAIAIDKCFSASSFHSNILQAAIGGGYKRSFNGFLAKLTDAEKERLSSMEGVVSVFPNEIRQLHTTRSWDFIGFPQNVKRTTVESDIIVGMLDSGIWPESKSFNDSGYGPPPSKWKGSCETSSNFTCNNKIIGAKHYLANGETGPGDILSPRDTAGHGSHTASTAAGVVVTEASMFGLGAGTARGGVPSARIAVYKICWAVGCFDADILAAFDDAIADGVDIISLSVGGSFPEDYFENSIAIGAFHAMKNGILTSNSAGNRGPGAGTITNFSPWSLSVAASVIDRKFVTDVTLGNKKTFQGVSVNTFNPNKFFPLVYGGDVPNVSAGFGSEDSRFCSEGTLDKSKVKGKIVLCDALIDGSGILGAGGIGAIMQDGGVKDMAFLFPISTTYLGTDDGTEVATYINTTSNPTANIEKSTEIIDETGTPFVVSFSSRGPNPITVDILKPDLSAPGVDILAAWSELGPPTEIDGDNRVVPYNIISGTSMACPHATGAAAYVKSFNPTWSPAAIKSALMTTATMMTAKTNTDAEFAYGSGQINPIKAVNPGLVYDLGEADYVSFLCGQGYNTTLLRVITGDNTSSCTNNAIQVWDLNYPSFTVSAKSGEITRVFHRTVTNVGSPVSIYTAKITVPSQMKVVVKPTTLSFKSLGQKQSFTVTVTSSIPETLISGSLVWDDGVHQVRSPIVAHTFAP
ncbi:OLC1v1026650C1 [Oldenlandia corymbosa var. corymbosa]|uniref:OLC1v1026650C1 n=1 Tax=Oldenlandia corymbosa var. corymbosa TaxID=529605 RepID=A0AAV1C9B1_OLDCO|nr:OLC1v1026650C1 [Oldenlandia corymbosa var. corymbosa]